MCQRLSVAALALVVLAMFGSSAAAQDQFKSGPQVGEFIPGSFNPFNVNGKFGKKIETGDVVAGRHHCLVCEYDLKPVVVVFFRETKEDKTQRDDKMVMELLKRIDKAIDKDKDFTASLSSFAVFLSPFGTDTVIEASLPEEKRTKDPAKLVDLALGRKALLDRLDLRAGQVKHVIITYFPDEGPKGYNINSTSECTVVLYVNFKVQGNFAFESGQMTEQSIDEIMKSVDALVGKGKSKADSGEKPAKK